MAPRAQLLQGAHHVGEVLALPDVHPEGGERRLERRLARLRALRRLRLLAVLQGEGEAEVLREAYAPMVGFLFGWVQLTVILTGSIVPSFWNSRRSMQVTNTGVQITNAAGTLGGGQITFGGSVLYRPQLQMNVAVSAKGVRLRYPEGMRTIFDSDLTLSGNQQASLLQGRVLVDGLSFTQDLDISTFMGQFTGSTSPPDGQSFADHLKLQIAVQSTSQLSAGTSQLSIEGDANLRVIGSAADPVIVGRTNLTSGDVFFMKRQYHLERGIITFANPSQTDRYSWYASILFTY
jgi:hypothetical protein